MDYTYKLVKNSAGDTLSISRSDGASIPVCDGNTDYQKYLVYAAGKTIPVQIIPDPIITQSPSLQDQIDAILELI